MMDLAFLEKLLDLLSRSDADMIEIRRWSTTIRISKNSGAHHAAVGGMPVHVAPPVHHGTSAVPLPSAAPEGTEPAEERKPAANLIEIKSPMVGTFYAQPEPGADPYVRVGSRIGVGQTLCIIEAMKIMNPLDSDVSGVIAEVAVNDAQPVEYGQVLFRVDPNG